MPASSTNPQAIVEDPESPISTVSEAQKVRERVAIGVQVVSEAVRLEGEDEMERPCGGTCLVGLGRRPVHGVFTVQRGGADEVFAASDVASAGGARRLCGRLPDCDLGARDGWLR
jgi:hypothetical protein